MFPSQVEFMQHILEECLYLKRLPVTAASFALKQTLQLPTIFVAFQIAGKHPVDHRTCLFVCSWFHLPGK